MTIEEQIVNIKHSLPPHVHLVAISKTHPVEAIESAYSIGQRIFGENRPQEMKTKWQQLPKDIEWRMIGHLQTNKVRMIAEFVSSIDTVDSIRLIELIDKEAQRIERRIDILLELKVAQEDSKHGWNIGELTEFVDSLRWQDMTGIRFRGIMGMSTYTDDQEQVRREFTQLHNTYKKFQRVFGKDFDTLSMGMTSDYELATECGSTMVRIGSLIFGNR